MNQAYVIATSTKVDSKAVDISKMDDAYFKATEEPKKKKGEDEFFKADAEEEKKVRCRHDSARELAADAMHFYGRRSLDILLRIATT